MPFIVFQNQSADRQKKNKADEIVNNFEERCVIIDDAGWASNVSKQKGS